jgi:hypothetical protein
LSRDVRDGRAARGEAVAHGEADRGPRDLTVGAAARFMAGSCRIAGAPRRLGALLPRDRLPVLPAGRAGLT